MKRHTNKSKRVSRQCRNNGRCSYCRGSRLHNSKKRLAEANEQVKNAFTAE